MAIPRVRLIAQIHVEMIFLIATEKALVNYQLILFAAGLQAIGRDNLEDGCQPVASVGITHSTADALGGLA